MTDSVLDYAKEYIDAGIKCIPVTIPSKVPKRKEWSSKFLEFDAFKSSYNQGDAIGVVTGHVSGIICIDIDNKGNRSAVDWYLSQPEIFGDPLVEKSPSGGIHLYYSSPVNKQFIKSSKDKIHHGVEVKGDGGFYVVTSPSPGYVMHNNLKLTELLQRRAEIPDWLFEQIVASTPKEPAKVDNSNHLVDIDRCIEAIKRTAPAVSGNNGDEHTLGAALTCRDFGLTQEQAFSVLLAEFNPRCIPPWSHIELRTKVNNAYKYGKNPIGVLVPNPEAEFAVEALEPTPVKPPSVKALPKILCASSWFEEEIVESNPVIRNLFDEGDKVMIIGQSKARKSFLALQLAISIAGDRRFLQFDTCQKKVLLVQFEIQGNQYHARGKKLAQSMGVRNSELDGLFFINARGATRNFEDVKKLIMDSVDSIKPQVVILDPLYKLIEGDESKIDDVKPVLSFFDSLAETSKAAIVYAHHDKKGISSDQQTIDRGAGSGVLARDIDCGIYLSHHKDQKDTLVVDFVARNKPPLEPLCIEYVDYKFAVSGALPERQTKTSSKVKIKHEQRVEAALELIRKEIFLGNREMGTQLFNTKLKEAGITRDELMAVKDSLLELGAIEETTQKAIRGGSSKVIHLTYSGEGLQTPVGSGDFFDKEMDPF